MGRILTGGTEGRLHEITFLKGKTNTLSELMLLTHHVMSPLERWLMVTHQGAVSPKHLDYYWTNSRSSSTGALQEPRQAVLPPSSAGPCGRTRTSGSNSPSQRGAEEAPTIRRGHLNQADTHLLQFKMKLENGGCVGMLRPGVRTRAECREPEPRT